MEDLERKREEEQRPLEEAGEGEAEGFELAEEELERNASHEDPGGNPLLDRFPVENESEEQADVYGDADEEGDVE